MKFKYIPRGFYFNRFQQVVDDSYLNIFYLTHVKDPIKDIKKFYHNPDIVAHIEFYTNDETDEAQISSLYVSDKYRGRGYAIYLMLKMGLYLRDVDIKTITLEDVSNRYRKPSNIYLLLGFKYISEGMPEMFTYVDTLIRKENFTYFKTHWAPTFFKRK